MYWRPGVLFCLLVLLWGLFLSKSNFFTAKTQKTDKKPPNIILIVADDLGYGDLSSYGNKRIKTPHLDRLVNEGQRWTQFYVAASVCTPSRAGLLTGRYPIRSGMAGDNNRILYPNSTGGLPASEITIAEYLKQAGYTTGLIGKWHLGHRPEHLPLQHGFDYYFGIPYSHDMDKTEQNPQFRNLYKGYWKFAEIYIPDEYYHTPLYRNNDLIERPADHHTLNQRLLDESLAFIEANRRKPFFLYLAHHMPHIPLYRSKAFEGVSKGGIYGDVVEELDFHIGIIADTLQKLGLSENTLLVFTSDNGPWEKFEHHGGSSGVLRAGKGTTWEGGMRVPAIFWWPGALKPGVVDELGSTLDFLPTFSSLAGLTVLDDRLIDGVDLTSTLFEGEPSPRKYFLYYRGTKIFAVRLREYKAHFITKGVYRMYHNSLRSFLGKRKYHKYPLLYNLAEDPGEQHRIKSKNHPIVKEMHTLISDHKRSVKKVKNQLQQRVD